MTGSTLEQLNRYERLHQVWDIMPENRSFVCENVPNLCRQVPVADKLVSVIDNYAQAIELTEKMKRYLPFSMQATDPLRRLLRQKKIALPVNGFLTVDSIFYMGDEGGIGCAITPSPEQKEMVVVSLTHLKVDSSHPLAEEIYAYQQKRNLKLAVERSFKRPFRPKPKTHKRK